MKLIHVSRLVLLSGAMSLGCAAVAQVEGPIATRVIVRAESKTDAAVLHAADVQLEIGGHAAAITAFQPLMSARGPRVEVALLIDDGLRSSFGLQLKELEKFVADTASPNVAVGVGYMQNGRAIFPAGFSTEAEVATKAIRVPLAAVGVSASPYFCLSDLLKHWPTSGDAAHVVLMITDGNDPYNGAAVPSNQDSPYVDTAVRDAQRAGVPVYSIYFGRREVNSEFGSLSGQSYLQQVAEGTGGKSFNIGSINPVSIAPYLKEFERALRESYLMKFQTNARKSERLKISTKVDGVKLRAQEETQPAKAR